jgi:ferritin
LIKEKIQGALNDQLNWELYSAYIYFAMAAHFESVKLPGCASWMKVQAQEELTHAMKFYDFVNERSGRVKLAAVEAPPAEWDSPLAAFEHAYEHEQGVSERINKLVDVAVAESDDATNGFLQWFVTEQVEEEASVDEIVQKLKLVGKESGGLFMLDRELAQRVFVPPAAAGSTAGG